MMRRQLDSLSGEDFERILLEPENSLIKQYTALMEPEGVKIEFTSGAIQEIARIADEIEGNTGSQQRCRHQESGRDHVP